METEGQRYRLFTRRAALLGGAQTVLMTALFGRMYYLGVVESGQYKVLAEDNRVSLRLLAPERGEILDRFGRKIATNRRDYRVFLIPEQADNPAATLASLERHLDLTPGDIERLSNQLKRQRAFLPVTVAENLSWEQFAKVNVDSPNLPGIQPDAGRTRYYPDGEKVAPIVGYVGPVTVDDIDGDPVYQIPGFKIGRSGLERGFDDTLRGSAGSTRVEVNAYGRVIRELARQDGDPGDDLTLTVDLELQRFAAERLAEESAAALVMDVHGGDLLALVSTPAYDPNWFNVGISPENWRALQQDPRNPLVNKAVTGQYPPGSTFKMIVAIAALEAGVTDPERKIFCNSEFHLGDSTFRCWKRGGHGSLALVDAISQSCDVYFYQIARDVGIEKIAEVARRFGFGERFDLALGSERSGLVPSDAWKRAARGERWHLGETVIVGIGQGALLATPLQLAVMTARLANGGKAVRPRLVRSFGGPITEPDPIPEQLEIDPEHLALVQAGMEGVLKPGGTAWGSRLTNSDYAMAGKTGTSQVRRITEAERESNADNLNETRPWRERDHAVFVAYAPVEAPRYAVSVLVEHGGGGSSAAAPVGRDIMRRTLELDPVQRPSLAEADAVVDEGGED